MESCPLSHSSSQKSADRAGSALPQTTKPSASSSASTPPPRFASPKKIPNPHLSNLISLVDRRFTPLQITINPGSASLSDLSASAVNSSLSNFTHP